MILKFCKNTFSSQYKKTLGVDYLTVKKYVKELNKEILFCIWDTAGQECYYSITKRYYKGANAALIVFSMNDRDSFNQVGLWYEKIISECDNIPIILVMSKIDLYIETVVDEIEARQLSVSMGLDLVHCSSKKGIMVNELFENLAIKYDHNLYSINNRKVKDKKNNTNEVNLIDNQSEYIPQRTFKLKIASQRSIKQLSNIQKKKCC